MPFFVVGVAVPLENPVFFDDGVPAVRVFVADADPVTVLPPGLAVTDFDPSFEASLGVDDRLEEEEDDIIYFFFLRLEK